MTTTGLDTRDSWIFYLPAACVVRLCDDWLRRAAEHRKQRDANLPWEESLLPWDGPDAWYRSTVALGQSASGLFDDALSTSSPRPQHSPGTQRSANPVVDGTALLDQAVAEVEALRDVARQQAQRGRRPYFAQRNGHQSGVVEIRLEVLLRAIIAQAEERLELSEAFGWFCADADGEFVSGELTSTVESGRIDAVLGIAGLWEKWRSGSELAEAELLTMVEFFSDHVSRPGGTTYHGYDGSTHPTGGYQARPARTRFTWEVNDAFSVCGGSWNLRDGVVERVLPDGFDELADQVVASSEEEGSLEEQAALAAVSAFRKRDRTRSDLKYAVERLGFVLEPHRERAAELGAGQAKSAIFKMLNEASIRHNAVRNQTDDYDDSYLEWLFYTELSLLRLLQQNPLPAF